MLHKNPSFDDINSALHSANAMTETAEAHGTLCGMICVAGESSLKNWLSLVFEDPNAENFLSNEVDQIFTALHDSTLEKLTSLRYDLEILLHSDDAPLDVRVEDLCLWCQGFLYGLSVAGLTDIKSLPTDASEILQDMSDISKAGYTPENDDEENEVAFAEIVEYIRIGIYVIFNTFNTDGTATTANTVH